MSAPKSPPSQSEIEEIAHYLCLDTVDFIGKETPEVELELAITYLSTFVGHLVYQALTAQPEVGQKLTKAELTDFTHVCYKNMKTNIENAVAAAFKGALETYSNKHCEYYCTVQPVPAAANKQPC